MTTDLATVDVRLAVLQRTLELAGWQVDSIDIDATADRARIELRQLCGPVHVVFDGNDRSHMIEREVRRWVDSPKRYGGRWDMQLLGRTRVAIGWRGGLRLLCTYLADNGTHKLDAAHIRAALAPMMQ